MEPTQRDKAWTFIAMLLLVIIVVGGYTLYRKRAAYERPLVVRQPDPLPTTVALNAYIGGAVKNPGYYPAAGSLQDLIACAGGATSSSDLTSITVTISSSSPSTVMPQKININTAESWLLEALPQIGKTTAQEIINYRAKNGPFQNTLELARVKGVGEKKFELVKDLITVGGQ